MNILDLFSFWTSHRWPPEHPAPQIWIFYFMENVLPQFTSFTLCMWHMEYRLLHIILQVAQAKAEKDNVGESLKDDNIKEAKAEKLRNKEFVCNIFHVCSRSIWPCFEIAQSVTFSSMFSIHFFVKHKIELFKCENLENLFKTKGYLVCHGTTIHNKCHICGKIINNKNTLTKHYVK